MKLNFEIVLSSLVYHNREWFVFQAILPHLPKEIAALADQRSKDLPRYTTRFGICKDWVKGDRKKKLIERRFIDEPGPDSSLIFSGILIESVNFEELLRESFDRPLTLKIERFVLAEKIFTSSIFEWSYDPKEKGAIKKTEIAQTNNVILESGDEDPEKGNVTSKTSPTKNLEVEGKTSLEVRASLRYQKRRRSSLPHGKVSVELTDQEESTSADESCGSSISERISLRPRKKAKGETLTNVIADNDTTDHNAEICSGEDKNSRDKSPLAMTDGKRFSKRNTQKNSLKSKEVQNERLEGCSEASSNTSLDEPLPFDRDDTRIPMPILPLFDELLHSGNTAQSTPPDAAAKDKQLNSDDDEDMSLVDHILNEQLHQENDDQSTLSPLQKGEQDSETVSSTASLKEEIALSPSPTDTEHVSPLEKALSGSPSTLMENIKQKEKQLCSETEDLGVWTCSSGDVSNTEETTGTRLHVDAGELECSSCDANTDNVSLSTDHSADCTMSTVCSCTNQDQNKQTSDKINDNGAADLLDGLIAAGFVPHVRQMLENVAVNNDKNTKVSKLEQELKTIRTQIHQRKKLNQQLQINIKKKARELEKLFENLRKGKAQCEMLEQKYKILEGEKASIDAKLKKCLEILNSVI